MSFLKFDNVTAVTADLLLSDVVKLAIRNGYIDLGASASAEAPDTAIATREDIKFSGGHMFQIIEHNGPLETIPQGTIPANGQKVYEYLYPKQYAKIIAGHQFAVTEVLWNSGISGNADAYKGCWSLGGEDEYGNWVRAPKLNADTNYRAPFLRGSQIGVDAGKLALDQFQKHWHASGDTVDTAPGSRQAAAATSGNYPVYNLSDLAAQRLLPSTKYLPDGGGVPRVGDETHPRYHGVIMCIRMFGAVSNPGSLDAAQLATDLAVANTKIATLEARQMALGDGQSWVVTNLVADATYTNSSSRSVEVLVNAITTTAGGSVGIYTAIAGQSFLRSVGTYAGAGGTLAANAIITKGESFAIGVAGATITRTAIRGSLA